ncbi:MAG: glycosyltransferase family 2 protein [Syntrophomonas sp.]|nr:glycosyltransferase family 2 protein [Syntrophomonas sp.]
MMISVVVPVFNSGKSLAELYARLVPVLDRCGDSWEIIMVDDASRDDSYSVMESTHQSDPRVKLIRLAHNAGQHNATLCGLRHSQGGYIVTIDDDLQHPPEEIPVLLEKIQSGYDVVFGIPREKHHQVYRNWGSRLIDNLVNAIFPRAAGIRRSSFRIMTRELLDRMLAQVRTPVYMAALILTHARRPGEVEVKHQPRQYGRSNYNIGKTLLMTRNLLINYSCLPWKWVALLWGLWLLAAWRWLPIGPANFPVTPAAPVIVGGMGLILDLVTLWLGWEYGRRWRRSKQPQPEPYVISNIEL